jgi:hypothetical protein
MGFPFTANFPFGLPVLEEVPAGTGGRYVTATLQQCKDLLARTSVTLGASISWDGTITGEETTCTYNLDSSVSFADQTEHLVATAKKCFPLCGEPSQVWHWDGVGGGSIGNVSGEIFYSEPNGANQFYTNPPTPPAHCPDASTNWAAIGLSTFDLTARFYRSGSLYKVSLFLSGTISLGTFYDAGGLRYVIHFYMFTGSQSAWEPLYPPGATWQSAGGAVMNGIGLTGIVETPTNIHGWVDSLSVSLAID